MASFGIADSVRLLIERESLTEVRALFTSPSGERYCRNQYYFGKEADKLAKDVHALDQKTDCIGIYLIPNPVDTKLAKLNTTHRKPFITKIPSSNKSHMLRRLWILIDCDSIRPGECSASEAERTAAFELADSVVATLSMFGFVSPIRCDSGNGCHILYAVDMPPDQQTEFSIKEMLGQLTVRVRQDGAKVDPVTWDSQRMVRLYGTKSRKGESTAERPWRTSGIVSTNPINESVRKTNTNSLRKALEAWREQDEILSKEGRRDPVESARKYLSKVEGAVSGAGGHNRTYRTAMLLVEGFGLNEGQALDLMREWNEKCQPKWLDHELQHKIESASEKAIQSRIGHLLVKKGVDKIVEPAAPGIPKSDATVADLIRLGQSMQWVWPGWIQRGVIVGIAAEPGAGKTRTCADLAKRIYHGLPWPDGTPPTLDKGSKVLWLCCDGQWGEITTFPAQFGIPPEAIYLNSWNLDPTEGTVLDEAKHFKELEDRINRTGVSLVFVDTVMNSTTHNTMRPEDGIKYFKPLAEVAQKTNTTIILVTHLSSGGEALGRRIVGQCRQMISLAKVEGEPHNSPNRRLWVSKSNSAIPGELAVELRGDCNFYHSNSETVKNPLTPADWVKEYLSAGPKPLELVIDDCLSFGIKIDEVLDIIYSAGSEYDRDEYKWIRPK